MSRLTGHGPRPAGALRTPVAASSHGGGRAARGPASLGIGIALLLTAASVQALEMGALTLQSRLGEPLAATVRLGLAPGEMLAASCLASADPQGGLPHPPGLRVALDTTTGPASAEVRLSSASPLTEPAYGLRLRTSCAGLPAVTREYVLVPDLPVSRPVGEAAGGPTVVGNAPAATPSTSAAAPAVLDDAAGSAGAAAAAGPGPDRSSTPPRPTRLAPGERYTVQPGDTLWAIASRVEGLAGGTGATAAAIHGANPGAFIATDPGRLRAGARLVIPASGPLPAGAPSVATATPTSSQVAAEVAGVPTPAADSVAAPPAAAPTLAMAPQPANLADAPASTPAPAPAPAPATVAARTPPDVRPASSARGQNLPTKAPEAGRPPPAAPAAPATEDPLVSGLAGVGFGLLVSLALWRFGPRRARWTPPAAAPVSTTPASTTGVPPVANVMATPLASPLPAISVSFEPLSADDQAAAGPGTFRGTGLSQSARVLTDDTTGSRRIRPADEITAELEELFNSPPAPRAADEPAVQAASVPASGAIDLPALAVGSDTDELKAQGLRNALALLEQDYELERTDTARTVITPEVAPKSPRLRGIG